MVLFVKKRSIIIIFTIICLAVVIAGVKIYLKKENNIYKISNITIIPEEYLCAPYHSWFYSGEYSVSIKYGHWCNLIKGNPIVDIN
ncbi:hypothetical protein H9X77_17185, partial [Clostridium saudiense]|nr:hypothetical protein [Clostridium saudiense]